MLWDPPDTLRLAMRALDRGARRLTREMLEALLQNCATSWKPAGYDRAQIELRARYEGNATAIYQRARRERFAATWARMPEVNHNWVGLIASTDAAVYDLEPERYLERNGERLAPESEGALSFARLIDDAKLAIQLPELERRAVVSRQVFAHVCWRSALDAASPRAGVPEVELYWPHDVYVLPHHSRPTSLDTCVALLARQAGPSGFGGLGSNVEGTSWFQAAPGAGFSPSTWFQVWTRPAEEAPDGTLLRLGPWSVELANLRGESTLPFGSTDATSPLQRLPWAVYRVGIASGCPYVDEDRDLGPTVDALNVNLANVSFVADMQGHDQPWVQGTSEQAQNVIVGPDAPLRLMPGESAGLLSPNPKIDAMLENADKSMRMLAVTRRQSPDAYATERPGQPPSGVSRRIANEPQEKARRERRLLARVFEEQELLPILLEHAIIFGDYPGIDLALVPKMIPTLPPEIESRDDVQRRAIEARDAGMISAARAAVEAGWYPDEATAQIEIEKINPPRDKLAELADDVDAAKSAPDAPAPDAPAPADAAAVADLAFNGAQVAALLDLLERAATKGLPVETVREAMRVAFPSMTPEQAARMLAPIRPEAPAPASPARAPV